VAAAVYLALTGLHAILFTALGMGLQKVRMYGYRCTTTGGGIRRSRAAEGGGMPWLGYSTFG